MKIFLPFKLGSFCAKTRMQYSIKKKWKELDSFYTTSFAILKNKEQETYKMLFEKLKKMLIHVTIILELNQKICIVILKGPYLKQQKQYFLIQILNITFGIIKNH